MPEHIPIAGSWQSAALWIRNQSQAGGLKCRFFLVSLPKCIINPPVGLNYVQQDLLRHTSGNDGLAG